jgi:uncharacterized protein (TIGR00251 family)
VIQITACAEGCILPVRAQPGARRTGIVGEQNGALKVAVSAQPDKGKANAAVQEVLCEKFGLKRSQVELLAGPASRDKKFLLRGVPLESVSQMLRTILADG